MHHARYVETCEIIEMVGPVPSIVKVFKFIVAIFPAASVRYTCLFSYVVSDNAANSTTITLNDFTIGLIFLIVAVVELTKIPLATAVYYSVRVFWRVVFLIALILVNVSTFETIVTGFERINRERTKIVDKLIVDYNSVKTQIQNNATTQIQIEIVSC